MSKASEFRAWVLATASTFCLCAIGYRVLTFPYVILPDLTPTVNGINTALATINHSCSPGPCGTLANIDKLTVKAGDIAVDTQKQVVQSGLLIQNASQSLQSTSEQVNVQLAHVGPLLDSARAASDAIPVTLAGFQPLFVNANGAVTDARTLISSPAITGTLSNVQNITASGSDILLDAQRVSDKATADYLKPTPWYLWPIRRSGELLDIGAAVARHTP